MINFAGTETGLTFTPPTSEMGPLVSELVNNCPPLDTNSKYCNLLQCHHFALTSCAVLDGENLVGFVSGYIVPPEQGQSDTLFIWQVAVDKSQRGKSLGMKMMLDILSRPVCKSVRYLETTVTPDNQASYRMFNKLAESLDTNLNQSVLFDRDTHFNGLHDSENLLRIGPFNIDTNS